MKILFKNATIIKNFDELPQVGDLLVVDDKISFIGKYTGTADKVIDAKESLIMPGFVDTHTHSAMTVFKGYATGKTLGDWLYEMQKKEKKLTANQIYYATLLACLEYAKNGITTVNDNYFFADMSAKAFCDANIRAVVSVSQRYNLNKFLSESQLEALYLKITSLSPLITSNFYCHSIYNADEKMFGIAQKFAKKYNTYVSTHASETLDEVGKCASQNDDLSPIGLLEQYGFFDQKNLVIHATNVDENDICVMSKNNASVSANFGSNFKLASGIAPIYQMAKHGINVSLGTDGSASNNRLDMFREMYLAQSSQNILLSSANTFSSSDILKMATIYGAKALGLKNVGILQEGNFADLIMLKNNDVDSTACYNIFDSLVYSYGTEDVMLTMCNGKIIYENGKYNFAKSKNAILKKVEQIFQKL